MSDVTALASSSRYPRIRGCAGDVQLANGERFLVRTYLDELLRRPTRESAVDWVNYVWSHPQAENLLTADEKQATLDALTAALGHVPVGTTASVH